MKNDRTLMTLFLLVWALAIIDGLAIYYYWYWTYEWLDLLTHAMGGASLALGALWFFYESGYVRVSRLPTLVLVLLVGLVLGLLWEGYEYLVWMATDSGLPFGWARDTSIDLVMDLTGALIAYGVHATLLQKKPA